MAEIIAQSVTKRVPLKAYLADGVTDATGKTIAVVISKNGGAFANPSAGATNATEIASGWYYVDLSTTDTGTLGPLIVRGTATGVDNVEVVYNVVNANNGGLAALPNAAAEAAGGLFTRGTGAGQINQDANGRVDVSLKAILGTALTETAGQIAAGFKKLFDVAAPVLTAASVNQTGDNYGRLGAPTGASIAADVAAVKAQTATINADTDDIQTRLPAALVGGRMDSSVGAMAANVMTAAAAAADLTTELQTGLATAASIAALNNLSAAQVNAEADTALADVGLTATVTGRIDAAVSSRLASGAYTAPDNATIAAIAGFVDTEIGAIKARTDLIPNAPAAVGDVPTANQNADALLDRAAGVETGLTIRQWARLTAAALLGKVSGAAANAPVFRNVGDTKDRITAVTDADGNRTTVTLDPS